jgi:pyruvate formate lyase activating enzyme
VPQRYHELHDQPVSADALLRCIDLAKQADCQVEFRTTCVPQLVGQAEIEQLGALLQGAELWVLQQFMPAHSLQLEWQQFDAYRPEQLEQFAQLAEPYVDRVQLRGL